MESPHQRNPTKTAKSRRVLINFLFIRHFFLRKTNPGVLRPVVASAYLIGVSRRIVLVVLYHTGPMPSQQSFLEYSPIGGLKHFQGYFDPMLECQGHSSSDKSIPAEEQP